MGLVLLIQREAFGDLPYVTHSEKSPPAVLQTTQGRFKYWIEIENPFSARHAEFLFVENGSAKRIPIQVFAGPATGHVSVTKADDWGTSSSTFGPECRDSYARSPIEPLRKKIPNRHRKRHSEQVAW